MRIRKSKMFTVLTLTLLIMALVAINLNSPTSAVPPPPEPPIYLHGPTLEPIHLNSNKTLTPVHLHSTQGLINLTTNPIGTEWHELYPDFCVNWNLTSWNDTGWPYSEFSPNDQIDMTDEDGNVTWYHVDRITITILLSGPHQNYEFDSAAPTMAIELKIPHDYDPYILDFPLFMNSLWHEVWPNYSNVYNLTSHMDNPFDPGNMQGVLDICDSIDLTNASDQTVTFWHVEDIATDIILREKIMDPRGTWWHAIYPEEEFCNWYNITSWEDTQIDQGEPGYGMLSNGDQIDMVREDDPENVTWYYVDRVTVTLNVSLEDPQGGPTKYMKIELKTHWFEEMYEVFKYPWDTLWHEVYPSYCNSYLLYYWDYIEDDNCNGVLDPCDDIWLLNLSDPQLPEPVEWHIEDMTYDLILQKKVSDPVGTWWHELYPEYCNWYLIGDWVDLEPYGQHGHGLLSPGDNVTIKDEEYNVLHVMLTLNVTDNATGGQHLIESTLPFEDMYLPKTNPWDTRWHEVFPEFCTNYTITDWIDQCNGVLDYCDWIELTLDGDIVGSWYHVEEVAVDMIIQKKEGVTPVPPPLLYWKANHSDYAPSGMPDFDQRQNGTYNWTYAQGTWSHCAPAAEANSLWWYDSAYENNTIGPPAMIDNFPLVTAYGPWDDHDPRNVQPLVEHLAYLMDTDGLRTGLAHMGTDVIDMQTGITQYLSWTGVNPKGDCNGDGIVDAADLAIVAGAMGTWPGQPGWDMAADIHGATLGWPVPGVANNLIDANDLALVNLNLGLTGMFYEHTVPAPDFYFIEEEVERCQDVVLLLGFWFEDAHGEYYREDYPYPFGHAVTVAGINSTTIQIAISDPAIDAFEAGLAPGRSPVPHPHLPPEPPYTLHNNASLVSHDIYNVTFNPMMGMWELENYPGYPTPPMHVLIENAVIVSPLEVEEVCGVEITDVVPWVEGKGMNLTTTAYRTWTIQVNVTVHNNGTVTTNCTVNAYAYNATNTYLIGTQNVTNLDPCNSTTLTFDWNMTGLRASNNYTVKANATCPCSVSDEFVDGQVRIRLWGDVDDSGAINILDLKLVKLVYSNLIVNPFADLDGNCNTNILDVKLMKLIYSHLLSPYGP